MKWTIRKILPAAALLVAGCVNVDYVGQSFDPTPEEARVEYIVGRSAIPAGKYRIIGRGTISTPRKIDSYDLREALIDEARKRGADAVVLVDYKWVRVGVYPREPSGADSPVMNGRGNFRADGSPIEVDTFGQQVSLQGDSHFRTELHARALFLKDRKSLEQLLARRGRELDSLVKQPDPADAPPAEPRPGTPAVKPPAGASPAELTTGK